MTDDNYEDALSRLRRMQDRLARQVDGPSAVEKHILLLRLTELVENAPVITPPLTPEQRQWLSRIGAVFSQLKDGMWRIKFDSSMSFIGSHTEFSTNQMVGYAYDVIEILRLELELDGRSEIGTVYESGNVYRYFADVKEIIAGATTEIFLIDPYFDGEIFDDYFGAVSPDTRVLLLVDQYAPNLKGYIERHIATYGSQIELRRNKNDLHDRMLFVDAKNCWFTGCSFKDAGKRASYLIPFDSDLTAKKYAIYREIWDRSSDLLTSEG